jgi:hypothetical protein
METFSIVTYIICDEVLNLMKYEDDEQSKMSNAEVMTFAIITAKYFSSNYARANLLCKNGHFFTLILSKSRLNRRIRAIPWSCWEAVFRFLAFCIQDKNDEGRAFAVDSFPISYCEKSRIDRRKIFLRKEYIGYAPSKKRYFCGIKVHMLVSTSGKPIEMHFTPACTSDISVLWKMNLEIPSSSKIYADGAYNDFDLEDLLLTEGIQLLAKRGKAGKNRLRSTDEETNISSKRQIIETVFSCITRLFPRDLRASSEKGFLIKIYSAVLAYSVGYLEKQLS